MHIPRENPLGVPWDKVALYTANTVEPASNLIKKFKLYSTGLISAVGMIIFGFVEPHFLPPEAYKNIDLHYYLTLGIGTIGGWLAFMPCIRYGKLVILNILGERP